MRSRVFEYSSDVGALTRIQSGLRGDAWSDICNFSGCLGLIVFIRVVIILDSRDAPPDRMHQAPPRAFLPIASDGEISSA